MKLKPINIGINKKLHVSNLIEKLTSIGYVYRQTLYEINAVRKLETGRYHVSFEIFPDEFIHESSIIVVHKDQSTGRFHGVQYTSKEINKEVEYLKTAFVTKKVN